MAQGFRKTLEVNGKSYDYYPIDQIDGSSKLPYSLKVLLENILRNAKSDDDARKMAKSVVEAASVGQAGDEVEFSPARVLFQDFTGVPVFVDFATMREACKDLGQDPSKINPQVPCDLVIDHSVIADSAGCPGAIDENTKLEFERNDERYAFLKWSQQSFENVRIVPPEQGICHQLNIEQFASVVMSSNDAAYFDTVVGTDSHTPTVNGIGVLGWGVGGIEAEAAALGQPITTLVPKVIGVKLKGALRPGVTAMDAALTMASILREKGVVGCFVECFGEGVRSLTVTQRACISNMTPEYGSTCTLFPIDDKTIDYLKLTNRDGGSIDLVRAYAKAQGCFGGIDDAADASIYAEVVNLDLSEVRPSVAGPSRPHFRADLQDTKKRYRSVCEERGYDPDATVSITLGGKEEKIKSGDIAIAAITSCTTATDPAMMLQAAMIAHNANKAGLKTKPWVKTILAPGSHATELLLKRSGLYEDLEALGFYTCGFGCMSCIGNSGPLDRCIHDIADKVQLTSVLSGNRNFDGRISADVAQNYLTSPAHVVAFAIAGTVDIDLAQEPLGKGRFGEDVFLSDIEPKQAELDEFVMKLVQPELFEEGAKGLYEGDARWQAIGANASETFDWDPNSTYVRKAPYFDGMTMEVSKAYGIDDAAILANLGDFITTDHISPASAIAPNSPAAEYLKAHGVSEGDFNTYGTRRGNHEVMARGTFANNKLENKLAEGKLGGWTRDAFNGEVASLFGVADHYRKENVPCVILAGKMYGSGSSRDWAAKGPMLLGVEAVIAESYERIHRSNLIGMGILPLQFEDGQDAEGLGLDGTERISVSLDWDGPISGPMDMVGKKVKVTAKGSDGKSTEFHCKARIDTPTEAEYYENGGILQFVLRDLA